MELFENETTSRDLLLQQSSEMLIGPNPQYIYFRDTVRFWVQRVLVPLIMVIGIVGNSITILIMTRRRMRSSTNWYLAALAIFDMIYLIFTFILSLKHYPNAHHINYYFYWYTFPFSMMITDASSNTSVWLTVTFTIERYIAVCHPIKGKVICTESRAKRVILCVFIICLSVTVPTPFEWVVFEKFDLKTNQTSMEATFSELGQNVTYKNVYYHLNVFLFILLPLVLLVIFNTFLIRSVHLSTKQRNQMVMAKDNYKSGNSHSSGKTNDSTTTSSSSRQEIRITIMLIAVVILFIVCQTPTACILIYTSFYQYEPNSNLDNLLRTLSNIFNFLMSINAAGNFVLYCLLSQKYRRTFVNMFCPCLAAKYLTNKSLYVRTNYESIAAHSASNQSHHSFNPSSTKLHVNPSSFQNNNRINCKYSTNGLNFNDHDSIMTTTLNNSNVSINNNSSNNDNNNVNNDQSSLSNDSLNHLTVSSSQTANCDKIKYLTTESDKKAATCDGESSNLSSTALRADNHFEANFVLEKSDSIANLEFDHSGPLIDQPTNNNHHQHHHHRTSHSAFSSVV